MSGPIKDVMQALNRHADVVERALGGIVSADADVSKASISGLRQASALRAAGLDGFRLHPRLRDYLYDHLQLFPAYQSLTEIGSRIGQLQALWAEVDTASREGDRDIMGSLTESLTSVIYDIADGIERNLQFLSNLLSTKYGNVKSLAAKVSQNRYYQHQAAGLASDLNRLERSVATTVETEAEARRMHELARLIRRVVLDKAMVWQHGLSDMQTVIRRELFRTREVQASLKHLARADMFLRQQPAWRGFEVDLPERIPDVLLAARLPRLVPHAEPLDTDHMVRDELAGLIRALPPKKVPAPEVAIKKFKRVVDEERADEEDSAAALALNELERDVIATPVGVELLNWRAGNAAAAAMEEGVWVVFAVVALRNRGRHVQLKLNPLAEGEIFAQTFYDARVFAAEPAHASLAAPALESAVL
jgi:hypothetical protein